MKKSFSPKKFIILLCAVAAFLLPINVFAASQGTIHIKFLHENNPISGAVFSAYRVADMSENGEFTITKAFSDYPISWDEFVIDKDEGELAFTLSSLVSRDNIPADAHGATDEKGEISFRELQKGVYLVVGDAVTANKTMYFPQPVLVLLPDLTNGSFPVYEVTIEPKYEYRELEDETITRKALKIWKNDSSKQRPSEITVQLLQNGKVYDEQVLSESNNWRYTWRGLDPAYNWQIAEKDVPQGYTVSANQKNTTFTITNTYNRTNTIPDKQKPDSTLPNTGLLWWPVGIMLAAGALFCVLGIVIRTKACKYDE